MGRRKKLNEEQLENTQVGLQIENESEMEAEEASLLAESDKEEETEKKDEPEAEVEAEQIEVKAEEEAPKPRRQRKPRKPRAPKEAAAPEAPVVETAGPNAGELEAKLREELAVAQMTLDKTMENVAKQWMTIKEMTTVVSQNFDKLNQATRPAEPNLNLDTADLIRPQAPQTLFITKFATAASIVAVLLSLVSMALSQSARQTAIAMETNRRGALTANSESLPSMKPFNAGEIAKSGSNAEMIKNFAKRSRR